MPVQHAKQDTRGVISGTLTVFNSQGSSITRAASDLVGPTDWNSGHAEALTISGNTAGDASSVGTATQVVMGATGGMSLLMSTAAGGATQWISRIESPYVMSEYEPISGSAILTNSSLGQNSLYFVPFYVSKDVFVSRINFPVSVGTTVSAGNNTGRGGITFSAALYTRHTASEDRITSFWSGSLAITGNKGSNTALTLTNVVGLSNSTAVSTVQTTIQDANATTYMAQSVGGYRMWCLPVSTSMTPGRYWLAVAASTTGSSNQARFAVKASVGMQTIGGAAQIGYVPVGTSSSASDISIGRIQQGAGVYSATSGAFPGSVALTATDITAGLTLTHPYFNLSGLDTASSIL